MVESSIDHLLPAVPRSTLAFPQRAATLLALLACMTGTPQLQALLDVNTNQMSDVWEAAYGIFHADAEADLDADGKSNLRESIAGTDPLDYQSVFRMAPVQHLPAAHLVSWASVAGKRYQLEAATASSGEDWLPVGCPVEGTGEAVLAAVPQANPPWTAFRIQLLTTSTAVRNARPYLGTADTDLDGSPDIEEWAAGTNPFDAGSKLAIGHVKLGQAVVLTWPSVMGKRYQVESSASLTAENWIPQGGTLEGTGEFMTATVKVNDSALWFRVQVADLDSDSDGITDWEEKFTGFELGPWYYRTNHPTDTAQVAALTTATNVITIATEAPVANVTRQTPGSFVIKRAGNLNGLTVNYTLTGDALAGQHFQALKGSVRLPPGVNSVEIPVVPLSGAGLNPSRSVALHLSAGPGYALGTQAVAHVNVLREAALSVTDFGAVGDGVTDDTVALQTAIDALEASSTHNTLHFPAGIYRLHTPTTATNGLSRWNQLLALGRTDLAGRDLFFAGEGEAMLYSTVSPLRAHMLVSQASFRSLWVRNLIWKKDGNPLASTTGEPNQADGMFILYHDLRRVEAVEFRDCTFDNCHGAVSTSAGSGYNTRGLLGRFSFRRCRVLNPYGSNTILGQTAFGGGQQVRLSPWVNHALYTDNIFEGGTDGPLDPFRNPGGRRKDGSHFGSPLHLIFTNNIVRRMGVEAVNQIDDPLIGATAGSLTFPPPDGQTTAQVRLHPADSTFLPGQILNFRTPLTLTTQSHNALMTVVAFDATNRLLTVTNPGLTPAIQGTVLPPDRPVYLQDYNPTLALIADNQVLDGQPGGFIGIASNSKATIARNFIQGYATGIYLYDNVRNPLNPPTPGTVLESNIILTRDTTTGYAAYGVESFGPGEIIAHNLIVAPRSYRFVGATARRSNQWLEANTVLPLTVTRNSYDTSSRAVGIGFGNGSSNNTAAANHTFGMDVGIGPENPFQPALHRVINHYSTNDVLAIDPVGRVP